MEDFVNDPYNIEYNFNLGTENFDKKQYAASFSFFQRCSEYTKDKRIICESLLTCSKILAFQGGRENKEYDLILHALSVGTRFPEVYYVKSLYHSWRGQWTDCYTTCCVALDLLSDFEPTFRNQKYFEYCGKSSLINQKIMAAYKRGKVHECRKLCIENNNTSILKLLPEPYETPVTNNKNSSQCFQDVFVETVCGKKNNGFYIELGAGDYAFGNNTYYLENEYDWEGISVDYNENFVENFNNHGHFSFHFLIIYMNNFAKYIMFHIAFSLYHS